jgi:hypothetical protein
MCAHRHHRMSPGTRSAPGAAPTAQRVLPRRAHHHAEAAFYGPGILVGAELLCALPARSSGNRADDLPAGASVSVGSWPGFAPARPGPIAGVSCPESACCWPRLGCCTSTRPSGRAAGRLEYAHVAATEFLAGCRPVAAAGRHRRRACRPRPHRPGRPDRSAAPLPRRGRRRDHRQPQPCGPPARDAHTLARRFRDHDIYHQAERDLRAIKIQQRTSGGCWRTPTGAGRLRRRPIPAVHRKQMRTRKHRRPHPTVHHRSLVTPAATPAD